MKDIKYTKKLYTGKRYFLAILLLLAVTKVSAQNCDFSVNIKTKSAYCGLDGAIEVTVSNPQNFGEISYQVKNSTGGIEVPAQTTNNIMSGFAAGNYTLTVSAACKSLPAGAPPVEQEFPFTINPGTLAGNPLTTSFNRTKSKLTSFSSWNVGKLTFDLSGGTKTYIMEIVKKPAAYDGPTRFMYSGAGSHVIDSLAPCSGSEYYEIKITDGCETYYYNQILIKPVTSEFPNLTDKRDISFTYSQVPHMVPQRPAYPNDDHKSIYVDTFNPQVVPSAGLGTENGDGTINLNDFFNSTDLKNYYELGFAYTTNPDAVQEWHPAKQGYTLFKGNYYYSQIYKNPTVGPSGTLPYIFLRLKGAPNKYRVYNIATLNDNEWFPQGSLNVEAKTEGLKVTMSYFYNTILTLPYEFIATNTSTGVIKKFTAQVPSDPSDPYNYEIDPFIILDWGSGKWQLSYKGISGGDTGMDIKTMTVTVGTRDEYFKGIKWISSIGSDLTCGSKFGNYSLKVEYEIPNVVSGYKYTGQVVPVFSKMVITENQPNPNGFHSSYTITDFDYNRFFLSSSTIDGQDHTIKVVNPGTYTYTTQIYDGNTPYPGSNISFNVKEMGGVRIVGTKLGVTNSASECYGRKITVNMADLKAMGEKRLSGSNTWQPGNIKIYFLKITGKDSNGNPTYSQIVKVSPYNFSFSDASIKHENFLLSDLTGKSNLGAKNPEFLITEEGEFVVGVVAYFNSADRPSASINSFTVSGNWSSGSECKFTSTPFVITPEDLSLVKLDPTNSGGYRCNVTTAGYFRAVVTSTAPTNTMLEYTLTAVDKNGNPTGAYIPNSVATTMNKTLLRTDIPTGINYIKLDVKPILSGCVVYPVTYTIPIYNLSTSPLLNYTGGPLCSLGGGLGGMNDLTLIATPIINTNYKWFFPDGTAVPGGTVSTVTIPAANVQVGTYVCEVTNTVSCPGEKYIHKITVSEDGSITYYWAVDATSPNWNFIGNWRDGSGNEVTRIPDKCVNVVIPGKVDRYYPDLSASYTTGIAICHNITFRYGGQVYHTERLDYDNAFVEYNTNYYGTLPSDDTTPSQPGINFDEGPQPEAGVGNQVTGLTAMARNRWWMLSAPIKGMYTGDFQMDGAPFTYLGLYNRTKNNASSYIYKVNPSDTEYISVVNDNTMNLSSNYNALMLWVPAFTFATGGGQGNLENVNGKIVSPSKDDKFNKFDMKSLSITGNNSVAKGTSAGRFIYENSSNQPGTDYTMLIGPDIKRTNGLVMIGNPFMAPINFNSLYAYNNSLIEDNFKILTATGWKEYNSSSGKDAIIAPLQGFVIKLKNPTAAASIFFNFLMSPPMADGFNIWPK
ncbi:hypothetical protein [Prevotella sp. 10(H)]|uniref:hypothetical protein n=1 Tax=Prevotella sp. 10(H) TaxID=1158294 RepID=UPI000A8A9FAA|nr:hypothetical protein [Prevotella sp. 10(H)]